MSSEEVIRVFLEYGFSGDLPGRNTFSEIFWAQRPQPQQAKSGELQCCKDSNFNYS